ncbi:hypothetical protein [Lacticaseibacillus parakribbianus]|uniref:hypothetical protein n=1 Tax=Lacticaseibacillus parakribbianus TaxID=2970927 RepID=UPI0021CB6E14|nr:hypothetical protein [Lacticaseibacillus parakribbianus]
MFKLPLAVLITQFQPELLALMTRSQLYAFLAWAQRPVGPTARRQQLVDAATTLLAVAPSRLADYFQAHPAAQPLVAPGNLPFAISYAQRKLLTAYGYLTVGASQSVRLYGHQVDVPAYTALSVFNLQALGEPGRTALLAQLHNRQRHDPAWQAERRVQAAVRASQKARLQAQAAAYWTTWATLQTRLAPLPEAQRRLGALAYWLGEVGRLGRYWSRHTTPHRSGLHDYDALQARGLAVLIAVTGGGVGHGLYRPPHPDRIQVTLCPTHWEQYRASGLTTRLAFYQGHRLAVAACPDCRVTRTKDANAVLVTTVVAGTDRFVVTLPYLEGAALYRNRELPSVGRPPEPPAPPARPLLAAIGEAAIAEQFLAALGAFGR